MWYNTENSPLELNIAENHFRKCIICPTNCIHIKFYCYLILDILEKLDIILKTHLDPNIRKPFGNFRVLHGAFIPNFEILERSSIICKTLSRVILKDAREVLLKNAFLLKAKSGWHDYVYKPLHLHSVYKTPFTQNAL